MLRLLLDSLDGLDATLHTHYKKDTDGKFRLEVDGIEDTGALKRAKEHEKGLRKKAEEALAALREEHEEVTAKVAELEAGGNTRKAKEVEEAWKKKFEKRELELTTQITGLNGSLTTLLVDNVAQTLAAKISKSPNLLLPHIKQRLKAEIVDGKGTTRVLDKEGAISAQTIEELEKELVANAEFAPIIIGSKATGGGAGGGGGGGGATKKFADMGDKERIEFQRTDPAGFQRAVSEQSSTAT